MIDSGCGVERPWVVGFLYSSVDEGAAYGGVQSNYAMHTDLLSLLFLERLTAASSLCRKAVGVLP